MNSRFIKKLPSLDPGLFLFSPSLRSTAQVVLDGDRSDVWVGNGLGWGFPRLDGQHRPLAVEAQLPTDKGKERESGRAREERTMGTDSPWRFGDVKRMARGLPGPGRASGGGVGGGGVKAAV